MDIATILGLIGSLGIIATAILLGGSFGQFIDIPSVMIVIGGAIFVVAIKFNIKQLPGAFKIAMLTFFYKSDNPDELITQCVELATKVRKEGILALEKVSIKNEFLAKGITMLVDGIDIELVKTILQKEKNLSWQRHVEGQRIFKAFGDVAPAMGMIGTLVGLVQMLANMSDPSTIGPAMAVALLTTLYGAVIANVICIPMADKLALRNSEDADNQSLIIDAIISIQKGVNPGILREQLQNYIPKTKRKDKVA